MNINTKNSLGHTDPFKSSDRKGFLGADDGIRTGTNIKRYWKNYDEIDWHRAGAVNVTKSAIPAK